MKTEDEERLLAELFVDLKGGKKKLHDWVSISTKLSRLVSRFGSARLVAAKLGVSYELVRSIVLIGRLPKQVQARIRSGEILYDAAQRLARIRDERLQIKVAEAIVGLRSHDAREVIQYARRNPELEVSALRERILSSRQVTQSVNIVVLPLRSEVYSSLKEISRKNGMSIQKFLIRSLEQIAVPVTPEGG